MEELLNLDIFSQFLTPTRIKVVLFVWNIIKCTVLLVATVRLLRFFVNKLIARILSKIELQERRQQLITLKTIVMHAIEAIIFIIYAMNMLNLFGIDVRPVLATAGVMGVAVGFGAKRFVEDIISGIIIIIEGQIRVGDYVQIGTLEGTVEKITLPLITVRCATSGALCFVRCGYIDTIINHTMNYSYATFEFDVAYKEDVEHVQKTLLSAFDTLKKDRNFEDKIIGDVEIMGLDKFKDSSIVFKVRIKTQPKEQWSIKREFNKIVKEKFEMENIEIPFNQLVVTQIQ